MASTRRSFWDSPVFGGVLSGLLGGLGGLFSGDENPGEESNENLVREREFLELLRSDADIGSQNRALEATVPIQQELIRNILDPTRTFGGRGLTAANVTPRTYQAGDESGPIPGAASLQRPVTTPGAPGAGPFGAPGQPSTQYGPQASPEELAQLIPDFSQYQAMQDRAQGLTAGITPEAFQRTPISPMLNEFERTRGQFLHYGRPGQQAYEEERINQFTQGNPGQAGDASRAQEGFSNAFPQYDLYGVTDEPGVAALLRQQGRARAQDPNRSVQPGGSRVAQIIQEAIRRQLGLA